MLLEPFMQTPIFNWIIMPLIIFFARIIDMTLGTIRVVMIAKGMKKYAPLIGFFEVFVWLIVVRQVITSIDNLVWMIAYAGGFSAGTYIGMIISDKIKTGFVLFRIITKKNCDDLLESLQKKNYRLIVNSNDKDNTVSIITTIVPAKDSEYVGKLIIKNNPKAFYTVENVSKVSEGVHVPAHITSTHNWKFPFRRQGK